MQEMHPQMRAVVEKNAENGPSPAPSVETLDAFRAHYSKSRLFWNQETPEMATVEEFTVAAPAGDIHVRLYRPQDDKVLPVLLFCHGGGFVYGDLESHDNICRQLASRSGWAVLAIDYHRAPEHKFPTPLEDVKAVISWLDGQGAALGLDLDCVAAGGDSAGASIMLGTAMDLREEKPGYLKHLMLVYGNYGLGNECESVRLYGGGEYGLGPELRKFFRGSYIAREEDTTDPRVEMLKADLSGLPPTQLLAAGMDPLRDNSPALEEKLKAAKVPVSCKIYDGVLHGFFHYTRYCDISVAAHDDAAAGLRAVKSV